MKGAHLSGNAGDDGHLPLLLLGSVERGAAAAAGLLGGHDYLCRVARCSVWRRHAGTLVVTLVSGCFKPGALPGGWLAAHTRKRRKAQPMGTEHEGQQL